MVTARTTSISLQGEDGIRAKLVTAVQTCALPIYSAPKSAPLGMVSFVVSTSPSGSSSAVAPNPCTLTPGTTSSTCLVTFTANTRGSNPINATHYPAPTAAYSTNNGSDAVIVTARTTSTTLDCPASTPANSPISCTFFFFNDTATTEIYTLSLHERSSDLSPSGSSSAVAPNPCTLTPGTTSSTCLVTFTA